jgi:phosphatidylinositol alpha 1,6-mannosyltransferase
VMSDLEGMRIAIITESFPPDVNGVAHCVLRVAEHLTRRGHHPLVIAPESARAAPGADASFPFPVLRVPSVPLPGYPTFRLGLPMRRVRHALTAHGTDVVHLASPVALGAYGGLVAGSLDLPVVAVYQTDLPAYARAYRLGRPTEAFAWRWLRGIHNNAARTLAPSTDTATRLRAHGLERVSLWGRGVDTDRFHPARRSQQLRRELAPHGQVLAGYVGRLANEKRVDLLAPVAALPGVRLVITGGGPSEPALRDALPSAVFLGERHGDDLARIYASMDVFVHSGPYETFGQTIQEAAASGLPAIAPAAGGPIDLIDDEVTGFLVVPGDGDALAAAVARLTADAALRAAQGKAARRKVLSRSWPALCDELIGHYAAVLGADAPTVGVAA